MQPVPQNLWKEYVQSQHFISTAHIMQAMKEMFRDVIRQVMEVEMDKALGRERCQRSEELEGAPKNDTFCAKFWTFSIAYTKFSTVPYYFLPQIVGDWMRQDVRASHRHKSDTADTARNWLHPWH